MKRYIRSARSESNYKNTDVLHINIGKASNLTYEFIRANLEELSSSSSGTFYIHVDSTDQYTIYINADQSSANQVKNLVENRFKSIAATLFSLDIE